MFTSVTPKMKAALFTGKNTTDHKLKNNRSKTYRNAT
jgi:hypothetical protein